MTKRNKTTPEKIEKEKRTAKPPPKPKINEKNIITKRIKPTISLCITPKVNSLKELIELSKISQQYFTNIDTLSLQRIAPHLTELDNMIGMKSLKETIFFQIIYYLQKIHTKSKNQEYLHTLILGPPGHGKCFSENTKILLFDGGYKKAKDIQIGDLLMGDDNSQRKVFSTCVGEERMYRVYQDDDTYYDVNASHILALKYVKSPEIAETLQTSSSVINSKFMQITYANRYGLFTTEINKTFYQKYISTLPQVGQTLYISVSEYLKNKQENPRWCDFFRGFKKLITFNTSNQITRETSFLRGKERGEKNIKAVNNNLTDIIHPLQKQEIYTTIENRISFLFGFLSTTTEFKERKNPNKFFFRVSKLFTDELTWIIRSLHIDLEVKRISDEDYYFILSGDNLERFLLREKLEEKQTIIEIEPLGVGNYYGFSLEGDKKCFCLEDTTITHNTEVSKIIGKLYSDLGILKRDGNFILAHRDDFIAGYLGQTSLKTKKLLTSALGGVLFIDEVYALAPRRSDSDSFSKEAIDTLNSFLSEHKNDFCCIAAGYEEDVFKCFFAMNKGLERRFPWVHRIEEYTAKELKNIFIKMLRDISWELHENLTENIIENLFSQNKELFKNAGGDMETLLSKVKMLHSNRVFSLTTDNYFKLSQEDMSNAIKYIKENKSKIDKNPYLSMYT